MNPSDSQNAELHDLLKELSYIGSDDVEDKFPKLVKQIDALVAQREQAAELRGRIDELDVELPKTIGYDVLWANPAIHQGVTARIEKLELQATKPEKRE